MKKLMLEVEALKVETFEVSERREPARGTVKGAMGTLMLSQCASGCMVSGIRPCFNTETCC